MNERKKAYLRLLPVFVLFAVLCIAAWLHKPQDTSLSERRPLAQFPEIKVDEVLEGDFCYHIGGGFWCRECVNRAAVIAAAEYGPRERIGFRMLGARQVGRYREREMAVGMARKGW